MTELDLAAEERRDELPNDLDITIHRGPHQFPNMTRRRTAGLGYVLAGALALWWAGDSGNAGLLVCAGVLFTAAAIHFAMGWDVRVDQYQALARASKEVGFEVGHSSAQLAWRGFLSIPTWRILVFSKDEPPTTRGLIEIDAVTGKMLSKLEVPVQG